MKRLICILMLSTMLFGCAANVPAETEAATERKQAPGNGRLLCVLHGRNAFVRCK